MDLLLKFMKLDWWVYIIVVVTFFCVALFLNYVVKKINEARLEDRFVRIQNKASNNQSIQVQRRAETRLLSRVPLEIVLEQSNPPTLKGISLVFDKNDNFIDRNKDRIDIKNFPSSNCLTTADVQDVTTENDVTDKVSETDVIQPAFLGKIYKELCVIERSKSMSNAVTNTAKDDKTNIIDFKKQGSKSASSVKKLQDNQDTDDFRKWSIKLVGEDIVSDNKPTTSPVLIKKGYRAVLRACFGYGIRALPVIVHPLLNKGLPQRGVVIIPTLGRWLGDRRAGDETPPCYVLQVDEFKFLLDCGWDEKFDMDFIKELKRHLNSIDAVLLSHSDPLHLGALPYAVGKLGLNCPIYATLPVYKMGQMFMYDLYQSHKNMSEFDLFSLDDVDMAFDRITQLKYNQSIDMKGKGLGLKITPLPAGHSLGGTVWRVAAPGEEDIVYAPDFNHKKERHLNGCEIERLMRPSLMLIGAMNADYVQPRRRLRDEKLMTTILTTLRGGGCVLVCSDTAGRVLELAHMLDQLWRNKDSGLVAYSLLLLSNVSYNVVEFAKSQIEWMSDKLTRAFEGARSNPFALRHLQLCHSVAEVTRTPGPKVVLASFPDLEAGFARDLFLLWAPHPQNSIVLTARTSPGTLARELIEKGGNRTIELTVKKRVRLEGQELEQMMQQQLMYMSNPPKEEVAGISSDSDSDGELEMWVVTGRHDIPVRHDVRAGGCFKSNKRHHAMYPAHDERTRHDDYGEFIKPEDYRLAEIVDAEGEIKDVAPTPVAKQEPDVEMAEIPTKCVSSVRQVAIKANIQYIELEGRCDGESLLRVVAHAKPRAVVGLRAGTGALQTLKKHCESEGIEMVYIPKNGDTIDATTESHIYQVKLTDSLMSGVAWRSAGSAELAWLSAQVSNRHQRITGDEPETDVMMSLEEAPGTAHSAKFINSVRLSELRAAIAKIGLAAEFAGGALECCNGTLAIRRLENGRVALEGVLSEEYYKVRDLLYEQFAIV